jgi:hypothetical protein
VKSFSGRLATSFLVFPTGFPIKKLFWYRLIFLSFNMTHPS